MCKINAFLKLSFTFFKKNAVKGENLLSRQAFVMMGKLGKRKIIYIFAKNDVMKKDNNAELLPIVDEAGKVVGSATRGECHDGTKLLHPVVHLHLFDPLGRLYLQRRPLWKTIQPGKWDTAVGGHIDYGEDVATALKREVCEELGITDSEPRFLNSYLFESEREREFIYVYSAVYDGTVAPSDELDGGRFWAIDEIKAAMGQGVLTPNFEMEFLKVMEWMSF